MFYRDVNPTELVIKSRVEIHPFETKSDHNNNNIIPCTSSQNILKLVDKWRWEEIPKNIRDATDHEIPTYNMETNTRTTKARNQKARNPKTRKDQQQKSATSST